MADIDNAVERPSDFKTTVARWKAEVDAYDKAARDWIKDGDHVLKEYTRAKNTGDAEYTTTQTFNIYWSSLQIQLPAVFSRAPVPVIERRWKDRDPVARLSATMLDRAVTTELDLDDAKNVLQRVSFDYQTVGRGVPWVRYEADYGDTLTEDRPVMDEMGVHMMGEDGAPMVETVPLMGDDDEPLREVINERACLEYVHWKDFIHKPCKTWEDLTKSGWVGRRIRMNRDALVKRFGDRGKRVPLKYEPKHMGEDIADQEVINTLKEAEVIEIWNAADRRAYWFCPDYKDEMLDERDDPLGLEHFFPAPRFVATSLTNESLFPTPDYSQFKKLLDELDDQSERIAILTRALKVKGIYDSSMQGLATLLSDTTAENEMIPVENMAQYISKGSTDNLRGVVQFMPIEMIVKVLMSLYEAREQTKQMLYEVSGISDIIRGQVDPREKLGQSKIKGQFATLRLSEKQDEMARLARDAIAIKAEIVAEHFSDGVLREISGFDTIPEVAKIQDPMEREQLFAQCLALIRSDKARGYRIDIETDSTITIDEEQAKEARTEFVQAIGMLFEGALPVAEKFPAMAPLVREIVLFTVRGFKAGRAVEGHFEDALDKMVEMAEQAMANPQPDPEAQKMQHDAQMDEADKQLEAADLRRQAQKDAMDHQIAAEANQIDKAEVLVKAGQVMQQAFQRPEGETVQ